MQFAFYLCNKYKCTTKFIASSLPFTSRQLPCSATSGQRAICRLTRGNDCHVVYQRCPVLFFRVPAHVSSERRNRQSEGAPASGPPRRRSRIRQRFLPTPNHHALFTFTIQNSCSIGTINALSIRSDAPPRTCHVVLWRRHVTYYRNILCVSATRRSNLESFLRRGAAWRHAQATYSSAGGRCGHIEQNTMRDIETIVYHAWHATRYLCIGLPQRSLRSSLNESV